LLKQGCGLAQAAQSATLGIVAFWPAQGFSPERLPGARGSMAEIAVAENQSYLAGMGLVCDKKADLFDHDPWNAIDFDENGILTRKLLKKLMIKLCITNLSSRLQHGLTS
jgi:hypothetical protein